MLREVAEYPNAFGPLAKGDERIDTGRYTLCMGPGSTWNTVQRQRFPVEELDEVLEEVRGELRARADADAVGGRQLGARRARRGTARARCCPR